MSKLGFFVISEFYKVFVRTGGEGGRGEGMWCASKHWHLSPDLSLINNLPIFVCGGGGEANCLRCIQCLVNSNYAMHSLLGRLIKHSPTLH